VRMRPLTFEAGLLATDTGDHSVLHSGCQRLFFNFLGLK